MRITTIEAIPVRVPLKTGLTTKTAHGDHVASDYVIVRGPHRRGAGRPGRGDRRCPLEWRDEPLVRGRDRGADRPGAVVGSDPTQITGCGR